MFGEKTDNISELSEKIEEESSSEALEQLIEISSDETGVGVGASMRLAFLAKKKPEFIGKKVDSVCRIFMNTEDPVIRRNLARLFCELSTEDSLPEDDLKRGLKEATRVRGESYWEDDPYYELDIIGYGMEGWTKLLRSRSTQVPEEVIQNIGGALEVADMKFLSSAIDFLKEAYTVNNSHTDPILQWLESLARSEDDDVRYEATIALSEIALGSEVSDEDEILDILNSNVDDVPYKRQKVVDAIGVLSDG